MNEEAIRKIISYTNESLFEPGTYWPKNEFLRRSYERWASDEIISALMDHPFTEADVVIEEFILKMELFLRLSDKPESNFIFHVAEDTAETFLGLIL